MTANDDGRAAASDARPDEGLTPPCTCPDFCLCHDLHARKQRVLARQAGLTEEAGRAAAVEFLTRLAAENAPATASDHEHEWTRRRMTNGQPWWSCSCGEATDQDPQAGGRGTGG